jgi:hypothetical protein
MQPLCGVPQPDRVIDSDILRKLVLEQPNFTVGEELVRGDDTANGVSLLLTV